jgi:hypothetical protein
MASPEVYVGDGEWGGADGTVILGERLIMKTLYSAQSKRDNRFKYGIFQGMAGAYNTYIIVAHEFGHVLQYKNGMKPDGPWQMEPHADFMAGWALRIDFHKDMPKAMQANYEEAVIDEIAKTLFGMGDTLVNEPRHHGEPQFRAAMVRAGYDARHLSVDQAFKKGLKLAGLA